MFDLVGILILAGLGLACLVLVIGFGIAGDPPKPRR